MLAFLDYLKIAAGLVVGLGIAALYNQFIHDPAVARAAREGFVILTEKTAAEAKAAEIERQYKAASLALEEERKRRMADELADQVKQAQTETEIADYEKKLAAANRQCVLDDADVKFLLSH